MILKTKVFYSEFTQEKQKKELIEKIQNKLDKKGIKIRKTDGKPDFFLILTGGTEKEVKQVTDNHDFSNEINILFHNGNNSLPATLEISAFLQQNDYSVNTFNCQVNRDLDKLKSKIKAKQLMPNRKIGVIGKPSDWLIASSQSKETVYQNWGVNLVYFTVKEFLDTFDPDRPQKDISEMEKYSKKIIEPNSKEIKQSYSVYFALKDFIAKHKLDAITIRCFDLILSKRVTACYALARLNKEGIPAGCEGDIPSIVGMLWSKQKTGLIPWMANPSKVDPGNGRLILAHCTAPFNYLEEITFRSHFESGLGVGVQGKMKFKDVTIFRIGGKNLNKLWLTEGTLVKHLQNNDLCRTQIELKVKESALNELLRKPLGNHLLILPGKQIKKLSSSKLSPP